MTLCFSDIETREAMRRLKEVAMTYGIYNETFTSSSDVSQDVALLKGFLSYLRTRESKRRHWEGCSPQLKYRKHLVQFIMTVATMEKMTSDTAYLGIYLADQFMDTHEIPSKQLSCVAIVCLVIAGKLFEVTVPRYRNLAKCIRWCSPTNIISTIKSLASLEQYVLKAFKFDVIIPTEVSFLEVYLLYVVDGIKYAMSNTTETDENNNNNNVLIPNANLADVVKAGQNDSSKNEDGEDDDQSDNLCSSFYDCYDGQDYHGDDQDDTPGNSGDDQSESYVDNEDNEEDEYQNESHEDVEEDFHDADPNDYEGDDEDENSEYDETEDDEVEDDGEDESSADDNDFIVIPPLEPFHKVAGTHTLELMQETAFLILEEVTRQAGPSNHFPPSQISAAILLAARQQHGLNFWTPTLQSATSYSLDTVYECLTQYVEPKMAALNMKPPTTPPDFVNVIFVPFRIE